ncbi:MAG TPA: DUF4303 domain-containing protein [Candidatus Dormibacteraeota bacterium]|nr:DUF4303 domain-containing protein [Candidatus Dormibacteraeota bacterium]
MATINQRELRDALVGDLEAAWKYSRQLHAEDKPYAFVLYFMGSAQFTTHVLTEQGLTRIAQSSVENGAFDELEKAREALRYDIADEPHFYELVKQLPRVEAVIKQLLGSIEGPKAYTMVSEAAMDALKELDGRGLFGAGVERESLLLVLVEDSELDWTLASAKRLNPPSVFERLQNYYQPGGIFLSSERIAVGGDMLYSIGTKELPGASAGTKSSRIQELVAYELRGGRLVRRWAHGFSGSTTSSRAVASTPNGSFVFVLRVKHGSTASRLYQFSRDKGELLNEYEFSGYPTFAVSPDGSQIAIKNTRPTLDILGASDLKFVRTRKLEAKPFGMPMRWLRSGEILLVTQPGLIRVDPASDAPATQVNLPCRDISTDDAARVLAVSQRTDFTPGKVAESGVQLLSLPGLEPIRTFMIPGHQAGGGVLSGDGKLLAFETRPAKGYPFIAAFDVETGRELGRRKVSNVRELQFLSDNRTVAFPTFSHAPAESVELWTIPEAQV